MRRLTLCLVALVPAALGLVPVANAAVQVADLRAADVVFDDGVTRPAADRERLQQTARDLGGKGFRTKFVVVSDKVDDIDALANTLRKGIGEAAVEAVLVLGPRQLGVDAKVFDCEKNLAFDAEVATLRTDDLQGTINVAKRLQEYHEAQALRDSDCKEIDGPTTTDDGVSTGLIALIAVVVVAGIAGFLLARRAAKRGESRRAADQADVGPPSPDE